MPNGKKVGSALITINQGNMFMVTRDNGEINSDSELGFLHRIRGLYLAMKSESSEATGTLSHP